MKRFSSILVLALGLTLAGASCGLTTKVQNTNSAVVNTTVTTNTAANANVTANTNAATVSSVTYAGQDGKNALELLQVHHQVDTSAQGFVNAIDSKKPGDHEFWAFYVNGDQAQVGAKDFVTKTTDAIEWKLEKY